MLNFIYIGNNKKIINAFFDIKEIIFYVVPNSVKAVNLIDNIKDKYDIVIFHEKTEMAKDISNIRVLHKIFPSVYQVLVTDGLSKNEKIIYLKNGINNTIPFESKKKNISNIIDFLTIRKKNKIKKFEKKTYSLRSFHLPIWKRTFDLFFSILALICLSPLFLITAIAIKLDSKGPIIYKSKRVGCNYLIFNCLKFRSMYVNADTYINDFADKNEYTENNNYDISTLNISEDTDINTLNHFFSSDSNKNNSKKEETILVGDDYFIEQKQFDKKRQRAIEHPFIKLKDDPRITKVGFYLRKFSIDELPQLINIIKGEMSIVGNRPLPLYEAEMLTNDKYIERFLAPAGLTGLWQVMDRGKKGVSSEERKRLDIEYAKKFSFKMDIRIIFHTFSAFIQKENV